MKETYFISFEFVKVDYIPDKNAGFRVKENLYPLRALLSESITKYLTQTSNYSTCFKSVRSHGT